MKLNLSLQALYLIGMLLLGATWLWGDPDWRNVIFYLTFFLGFAFLTWMGYLLDVRKGD